MCDLLSSTNRCGRPKEYFNPSLLVSYKRELCGKAPINSLYEFRKQIVQKTKTENDVAGIKVVGVDNHWNAFSRSGFDPQYWIRLYRQDTIMQAISRYKAWKTNEWVVRKGKTKNSKNIKYDREGVKWCLTEILKEEKVLDNFFASDKKHITIEYEKDLCNNPLQTVCSILEFMNINTEDLPEIKSTNTIIRTEKDEQWKVKFLKEKNK